MNLKIAVLPGDGIGPEVMEQALEVTKAVCRKFNHTLDYKKGLVGACAIDETGVPYPPRTHELCMEADAVLFGAVGDLKYDNDPNAKVRPEQGLLAMRKGLGLYANIRPVSTYSSLLYKSPLKEDVVRGTDFVCIRELTGGLYFGERGRSDDGQSAFDTCTYSKKEIERIVRYAYKLAKRRRKKVSVVDKANILATSRLWREVAQEIAQEYPDVETEFLYVDNAAMRLVQFPRSFDVLVTENMFGDILTDEGSVLTGSMGLQPSASIGLNTPLFEPIHGSWPQAAGQHRANPLATILSAAMMFEMAFKLKDEAALIREAVSVVINSNVRTEDIQISSLKPYTTEEVGAKVLEYINNAEIDANPSKDKKVRNRR